MYYSSTFAGNAMKRYAAVHTGSRIEGASAHGLVKILFDELLLAMEAFAVALDNADQVKANDKNARALTIIHALDSSLDFDKGGDIALSLAMIYRETRRLLIEASETRDAAPLRQGHALIEEIAGAWGRIG